MGKIKTTTTTQHNNFINLIEVRKGRNPSIEKAG